MTGAARSRAGPGWCPDPADPALPYDVDIDVLRAESRRIAAAQAAKAAAGQHGPAGGYGTWRFFAMVAAD